MAQQAFGLRTIPRRAASAMGFMAAASRLLSRACVAATLFLMAASMTSTATFAVTATDPSAAQALHALLDTAASASDAPATDARVGAMYAAFTDQSRLDALGMSPIRADLDAIAALRTRSEIAGRMGRSQYDFGGSLFEAGIDVDIGNPKQYAIYLGQAGLGMPGREYYLTNEYRSARTAYRGYVERLLGLVDWRDPAAAADSVVALETRVAEASWTLRAERPAQAVQPDEPRGADQTRTGLRLARLPCRCRTGRPHADRCRGILGAAQACGDLCGHAARDAQGMAGIHAG